MVTWDEIINEIEAGVAQRLKVTIETPPCADCQRLQHENQLPILLCRPCQEREDAILAAFGVKTEPGI